MVWRPADPYAAPTATGMVAQSEPANTPSPNTRATSRSEAGSRARRSKHPRRPTRLARRSFAGARVTPDGSPLPNVWIEFSGRAGNAERLAAHLRRAGVDAIEWQPPAPIETAADGRFELSFVPPPPFQFSLTMSHPDYPDNERRWSKLAPGTGRDFGDIRFAAGARVRGRLVDHNGHAIASPSAHSHLTLIRTAPTGGQAHGIAPKNRHWVPVAADGSFAFPRQVGFDSWSARCGDVSFVDGAGRRLEAGSSNRASATAGRPAPRGPVIRHDSRHLGTHCRSVWANRWPARSVQALYPNDPRTSWESRMTGPDGRFKLVAAAFANPTQSVQLRIQARGYQPLTTPDAWPWESRDLTFTLQPGLPVPVRVVRASDNQPVTSYELHIGRAEDDVWAPYTRVGTTEHAEGVGRAIATSVGPHRVAVIPSNASGLAGIAQSIEVHQGRIEPLVFRLRPRVRQQIVLTTADRRPGAGSTVELIDPEGHEITATTAINRPDRNVWPAVARLVDEQTTDANGHVTVTGPPDTPMVLRIRGEHGVVLHSLSLSGSELELELTSPPATRLTVIAQPIGVLERWRSVTKQSSNAAPRRAVPAIQFGRRELSPVDRSRPGLTRRANSNSSVCHREHGVRGSTTPESDRSGRSFVIAERLTMGRGSTETLTVDSRSVPVRHGQTHRHPQRQAGGRRSGCYCSQSREVRTPDPRTSLRSSSSSTAWATSTARSRTVRGRSR